ncbi:nuclease-related domain-containing protein [Fundicoccus culcitae]|uniref:NERD domain-containing protein n=1 Tax=Fundicoccus culcitae TaxID=2969821 RepID=A0ABY5P9K4_9LACT|nr:nuclease-related domain-containing protein [Fundicoccus culcitae]UUX35103.1 NERD domain-containing protein [Fundicoccus culcitae]
MEKNIELRVLEAMAVRGVAVDENHLQKLQTGYEGEAKFATLVVEFGLSHLMWVEDYWFKIEDGPKRQPDFLLVLPYEWIAFDVKNYKTSFEYREGKCYANGWSKPMDNIVSAAENRNENLQQLAREVTGNISVRSALVFINENCHVTYDRMPNDVELVPRTLLRRFLEQYRHTPPLKDWLVQKVSVVLDTYRTEYGMPFEALKVEDFASLRKGIVCGGCGFCGTERDKSQIICHQCGNKQTISEIVRYHTIQQRLLFYDNPEMVTTRHLYELMGKQITIRSIRRYMGNHFKVVNKGKSSYYQVDIHNTFK